MHISEFGGGWGVFSGGGVGGEKAFSNRKCMINGSQNIGECIFLRGTVDPPFTEKSTKITDRHKIDNKSHITKRRKANPHGTLGDDGPGLIRLEPPR